MPKSIASYYSHASDALDDDELDLGEHEAEAIRNTQFNASRPPSPEVSRLNASTPDMGSRQLLSPGLPDERSGLLQHSERSRSGYNTLPASVPGSPRRPGLSRQSSHIYTTRSIRNQSRRGSFAYRLAKALGQDANPGERSNADSSKTSLYVNDRVWYDQFTSTDWVADSIADAWRLKELRSRKDFKGRVQALFDGTQGWIIVAIIGILTAGVAFCIDVSESAIFDWKMGYCQKTWWYGKRQCCFGASTCDSWTPWSAAMHHEGAEHEWLDFGAFIVWVAVLAVASCLITLQTKTTISSTISLSTLDENLGADRHHPPRNVKDDRKDSMSPTRRYEEASKRPPVNYYPAAGSGVAEVKVILSGFVLHGYLGVRTLIFKSLGLILSVASGLSLGKEGPYVHIATCIGNICCRMFTKYRTNDGKRREVLSASAAAGVAVAFGAPIGGVLFSLEEVSYYFPPKTLFRTFFCCIAAALSLKFLDPYGTGKIVLFEVRYLIDWKLFEIIIFILLGMLGGAMGALFIKASRIWASTFRRISVIKKYPVFEVLLVAVVTGIVSFWNRYTRIPVAELLFELAAPCSSFSDTGRGLCPTQERIPEIIWYLSIAFVVKAALTIVTFGIKVPAGIYVPSMVVGGLLGRMVGHSVQLLSLSYPQSSLFASCPDDGNPESCIVPGVYALVAAGATMCGVTRLSVTLAIILFEMTGSLEHVLPFSLGVLAAKWTADALEPLSIYDLLTDMNQYPYLDAKARPIFTGDLGDITRRVDPSKQIDISSSPLVLATKLRRKLEHLHMAGELDGGAPIIRDGVLVGLIPAPDLEYALDCLATEDGTLCLMSPTAHWLQGGVHGHGGNIDLDSDTDDALAPDVEGAHTYGPQPFHHGNPDDPTDFTSWIDQSPVALDISSPMDLVFECFVKLGLRYICVLRQGKFVGMVHKKAFVKYVKEVMENER